MGIVELPVKHVDVLWLCGYVGLPEGDFLVYSIAMLEYLFGVCLKLSRWAMTTPFVISSTAKESTAGDLNWLVQCHTGW